MLPWKDTSREQEQIRFIQLWKREGGTFTVQTFSLWRVWPLALPLDSGESRNNLWPCAGRTRRGKWGGTGQCNAGELEARPKLGTSPSATLFCQHYGVGSFHGSAQLKWVEMSSK